jgi:hypothetical protein
MFWTTICSIPVAQQILWATLYLGSKSLPITNHTKETDND